MSLETICPGHEYHILDNCKICSPDYDTNHHPNNYDCKIFKKFVESYRQLESILLKKKHTIDNETRDTIITGLFLRNLIESKIKTLNDEQIIIEILDNITKMRRRKLSIQEEFLDIACINLQQYAQNS